MNCQICFLEFDVSKSIPRVLPCGHSFCIDCITKIISKNPYIDCPLCKKRHNIRDPALLPKNYDLIDLLSEKNDLAEKLAKKIVQQDPDRENKDQILLHKIKEQGKILKEKLYKAERFYEEVAKYIYELSLQSGNIKEKTQERLQSTLKEVSEKDNKIDYAGEYEIEIDRKLTEAKLQAQEIALEIQIDCRKRQLTVLENEILDLKIRIKENEDLLKCKNSINQYALGFHENTENNVESLEIPSSNEGNSLKIINYHLKLQVADLIAKESILLSENSTLQTKNRCLELQLRNEVCKKSNRYLILKVFAIDLLLYLPLVFIIQLVLAGYTLHTYPGDCSSMRYVLFREWVTLWIVLVVATAFVSSIIAYTLDFANFYKLHFLVIAVCVLCWILMLGYGGFEVSQVECRDSKDYAENENLWELILIILCSNGVAFPVKILLSVLSLRR